jgi:hypothetical protein
MSYHFVVLLVSIFRDRYPNLQVPLHLTGNDSCEIFFSKIGGMVDMERAYDFQELVNYANTLNQLAAVEYGGNGLQFGRCHNKQRNVLAQLHPSMESDKVPNLSDYSLVATDELVV